MKNKLIDRYFPFVLAALILCGTNLYPPLFNGTTRWLFVLSAFLLACISKYARLVWKTRTFVFLLIYLAWCLLTAWWSEIQELSLYKVAAAFLVMPGMFTLGFVWMMQKKRSEDAMKSVFLLVPATIIVAISGRSGQGLLEQGHDFYAGLAGNPNYLGWMMAVSIPFLVWKAFDHSTTLRHRWLFWVLSALCGYFLLLSQSRAAMILAFCSLFGFFISSSSGKRVKMIGISLALLFAAFLAIPNLFDFAFSKFVLKGSGQDLAYAFEQSRGDPFRESVDMAFKGGLFGAGYGISIGAPPFGYRGGLTTVGYGREKGSSPLAIVEETGLLGLVLVVLLLWRIIAAAFLAYRMGLSRKVTSVLGVLIGLLLGMLLHSNFEAWWVAPGSAESIFFWGITGMAYALFLRVRFNAIKP